MRYRIKSKLQYIGWRIVIIVVLASLVSCTNEEAAHRRAQEQNEQKAKLAAVEQKVLAIQNDLLNSHNALKFNAKEFQDLEPKFTLKVSNFFKDNYPRNTLFEGYLQDVSLQEDKYLVQIGVSKSRILNRDKSLDIFVLCPKAIGDKISLDKLPNQRSYNNHVYIVSNITHINKIPFQFEGAGMEGFPPAIKLKRWPLGLREGNFIAQGTCEDLKQLPSKDFLKP